MTNECDIVGIDFSGSKSPGRSLWITEGTATVAGDVAIQSIKSASERLGESDRAAVLAELVDLIADLDDDAVVGLDFPFGLPADCLDSADWGTFLENFHEEFEDATIDDYPGSFDEGDERKRETDYRYAGQSPFSPQIKYQVFYGLRDVLYPLVDEEAVRVAPMQSSERDGPTLVEIYPAATFGRLCCYRTGYKGTGDDARGHREGNLETLSEEFGFKLDDHQVGIDSDDALDSLCAACTAARAAGIDIDDVDERVEGSIFV